MISKKLISVIIVIKKLREKIRDMLQYGMRKAKHIAKIFIVGACRKSRIFFRLVKTFLTKHFLVILSSLKVVMYFFLVPIVTILVTMISVFGLTIVDQNIESKYMYNYATDYKYDMDVFFGKEAKTIGHIDEIVTKVNQARKKPDDYSLSEDADKFSRTTMIFLLNNKSYFLDQVRDNHYYLDYLYSKNLDEETLLRYVERMAKFGDGIIAATEYIIVLLFVICAYYFFNLKNDIYIVAGVVYIILTIDGFTSGFFFTTIYSYFNFDKIIDGITFKCMMDTLVPVKEAMLSFIIFEVVMVQKCKLIDRLKTSVDN